MEALQRNKRTFYYSLYKSKEEQVVNGEYTGTYAITYEAPVLMKANISASRGTAELEQFGINADYSKTIVTDDVNCPIDEHSILWIGRTPDSNGEAGTVKHNYVVAAVARSLNSVTYAVREIPI